VTTNVQYVGQVIIEKAFATPEACENWMNRVKNRYEPTAANVETHVWTVAR
jgi:hypothetical protein